MACLANEYAPGQRNCGTAREGLWLDRTKNEKWFKRYIHGICFGCAKRKPGPMIGYLVWGG